MNVHLMDVTLIPPVLRGGSGRVILLSFLARSIFLDSLFTHFPFPDPGSDLCPGTTVRCEALREILETKFRKGKCSCAQCKSPAGTLLFQRTSFNSEHFPRRMHATDGQVEQ